MQVSRQAEQFQPASSFYFVHPADQKLLRGITSTLGAPRLVIKDPSLRVAPVDRPAFSFSLWLDAGGVEGNIVWKPISPLGVERDPCWGFSVTENGQGRRFSFGAHDFAIALSSARYHVVDVPGKFASTGLHLENYVVSHTLLIMYQDGVEMGRTTLPRPVTDCLGNTVELGDLGLRIGEVAFFPKPISLFEVKEIFELGMPSYAIALGKTPVSVEPSANEVAQLDRERSAEISNRRLAAKNAEDVLRAVVLATLSNVNATLGARASSLPVLACDPKEPCTPCPDVDERIWKQPCRSLPGVTSSYVASPSGFFDLLPGAQGGAVRIAQIRSYPSTDFPTKLGGSSWTWTFWARLRFKASPDTTEGLFILSRVVGLSDQQQPQESWSIYVSPDGAIGLKDTTGSSLLGACMANPSRPVEKLPRYADAFRFFAISVDGRNGKIQVYIDGQVAKTCSVAPDRIVQADTALRPDSSISLGYMPFDSIRTAVNTVNVDVSDDQYAYIDLQQFRLYNGTVLNASDLAAIHTSATDPTSNRRLRQCALPSEREVDSEWQDPNGNDCEWYAENVLRTPVVCDNPIVQKRCATACAGVPCYDPSRSFVATLGSKLQLLDSPTKLVTTCISKSRFMDTWRQYSQVFVPTAETVTVYLPQEYISPANYADLRIYRSKASASDPCKYANDGKCDVPFLCAEGDWSDCFDGKLALALV